MLEIKQGINAVRIYSGSTAKCLKTQAFYSQVNSCQSGFANRSYLCSGECIYIFGVMQNFTRRELLKIGTAAAVAELVSLGLHGCGNSNLVPSVPSGCAKLTDIEHVVILIQENRSFDHYFGSYRGVRGFSDQSVAFQQPDPANTTTSPVGELLPFHLDTSQANAAYTHD